MITELIRKPARLLPMLGLALALSGCLAQGDGGSGSSQAGLNAPTWSGCNDPYHYGSCRIIPGN